MYNFESNHPLLVGANAPAGDQEPTARPARGPIEARLARAQHRQAQCHCNPTACRATFVLCGAVVCLLPLLAFAAMILPWYLIEVQPYAELALRLQRTDACHVEGHFILAEERNFITRELIECIPALNVTFPLAAYNGEDRAPPMPPTKAITRATPRLLLAEAWTTPSDARAFWRAHPVNSTTTCWYDPNDPRNATATSDTIAILTARLTSMLSASTIVAMSLCVVTTLTAGTLFAFGLVRE
jgi:hypothetical protein